MHNYVLYNQERIKKGHISPPPQLLGWGTFKVYNCQNNLKTGLKLIKKNKNLKKSFKKCVNIILCQLRTWRNDLKDTWSLVRQDIFARFARTFIAPGDGVPDFWSRWGNSDLPPWNNYVAAPEYNWTINDLTFFLSL